MAGGVHVSVLVRRLEESDRPWLVDMCKRRYPASKYTAETAEAWFSNVVLKTPIQFYATRSANAFQITNLTTTPWTPSTFRADIVFICADRGHMWEVFPLLRDSIEWARDRQAAEWRFETETDFDLGPIMKKLGCRTMTPRYHYKL